MTIAPTPIESSRGHRRGPVLLGVAVVLLVGAALALLLRYDPFGGSSSSAAEQGSGVAATQVRTLPSFRSVELAGSNNVVIRVGEKQSVVVKGDDNLLDRVTTRVESGSLVIGNTPGSFETKSPMSVEVTVPALTALSVTGSGNCWVSGIRTKSFTVSVSGSGVVTAEGSASNLEASVSGSGVAKLSQLVARDVTAVVSGSGDVFVTATHSLDASIPGSGAIVYSGNPQEVTKSITGSGAIVPS